MTIYKDRSELYTHLLIHEQRAVNHAFNAALNALNEQGMAGWRGALDDRAENLVGAIARYLMESRR